MKLDFVNSFTKIQIHGVKGRGDDHSRREVAQGGG